MMLATGVWWVRVDAMQGQVLSIGVGSAAIFVDGLLRLVRSLIVTCMGCLVMSVVCTTNLARSAVFQSMWLCLVGLLMQGVVVVWVLVVG